MMIAAANTYKTVSIVIPVKNEEEYLSRCLESICRLDYPDDMVEVIVVDNGSTDSTVSIAERYGARVIVNEGLNVSGLRNLGVERAEGDIVAFVDADCIVNKDWLEISSDYFNDETVAAWGSPPLIPDDATWVQKTWYFIRVKEVAVSDVDWLESMNMFVRRHQFNDAGGFNESLVTCEDVDFSYRIRKYGRIVSDSRIKVIHLGEASTIKEFVKKEIWRGQGNLKGIFSHGLILRELPSLLLPIYFIVFFIILGLFLIYRPGINVLVSGMLIYMMPSFYALGKISKKQLKMADKLRLLALLQFYYFARTAAVFKKT